MPGEKALRELRDYCRAQAPEAAVWEGNCQEVWTEVADKLTWILDHGEEDWGRMVLAFVRDVLELHVEPWQVDRLVGLVDSMPRHDEPRYTHVNPDDKPPRRQHVGRRADCLVCPPLTVPPGEVESSR
jgi:hypothetical protein